MNHPDQPGGLPPPRRGPPPLRPTIAALRALLLLLALLPVQCPPALAEGGEPVVVGYLEPVALRLDRGWLELPAKLDSGAATSSLGSSRITPFPREGTPWVRFVVETPAGERITLERPRVRTARIRRANTPTEERPVVPLTLCLGGVAREVEVNLAQRQGMTHPLLVGRSFLAGPFRIDPARRHLTTPTCPGQ